jgi:hypothetical protein
LALLMGASGACSGSGTGAPGNDGSTADGRAADVAVKNATEGQYCSVDPREDPFHRCFTPWGSCIATFRVEIAGRDGEQPVYVCRAPCGAGGTCSLPTDVCCPGTLADGRPGMACAPVGRCEPRPDAGAGR